MSPNELIEGFDDRRQKQIIGLIGRVADLEAMFPIEFDFDALGYGTGYIILWDVRAKKRYIYKLSQFQAALTKSYSGDIIEISGGTVTGNYTMIAGVKVIGRSRYATILTGQITGASGASIENLSIIRTDDSATDIVGVDSPAAGTFYINGCDIEATQAGAGDAYGLSVDVATTTIETWNSYLYGSSTGGAGYAAYCTTGTAEINGGKAYGSTAEFNV